jgi:hypothetical protein
MMNRPETIETVSLTDDSPSRESLMVRIGSTQDDAGRWVKVQRPPFRRPFCIFVGFVAGA